MTPCNRGHGSGRADWKHSVAGFLYVTLASLAAGLALDAVRAVTIDQFHHRSGVRAPNLDFSDFRAKFWAFNQIVESHYRRYQACARMAIAVLFTFVARHVAGGKQTLHPWTLAALCLLEAILLASSRDALRKFYGRAADLLGIRLAELPPPNKRGES
jgi:hypothetical protein